MTWIDMPPSSPFGPDNLPLGVFRHGDEDPRVGAAIGDQVIDLAPLASAQMLDGAQLFTEPTLNAFLALGRPAWHATRNWLLELVRNENDRDTVEPHLIPQSAVAMQLPFDVGDYVDFYASEQHATNLGRLFRPDSEPLLPNWKHLPVGYHGRSGTIVASGTDIVRPSGQRKAPDAAAPTYGPSQRLDIEVELGYVVGTPSALGKPVSCRRGSTCRWDRSSGSRSPRPSRRGSSHWRPSRPRPSRCRRRTRQFSPTWRATTW